MTTDKKPALFHVNLNGVLGQWHQGALFHVNLNGVPGQETLFHIFCNTHVERV